MQIDQIRTELMTMKYYMRRMEDLARQTGNMINEIEDRLMDLEDEQSSNPTFSPARQGIDRCAGKNIHGAAFVQELYKTKAI